MRLNGALISAQLWLIIATQNTNEYDEKVLAMIPEINFLSVRQKTLPTSFSSNNLTQHPHQQHDERRLLKDRNRRFQHYQQRKGETSMNKLSDDMESTVAEPLIRFPVVTFIQTYASNDTRLIPPVNSSTLQNIAFPVLPNSEEQRNKKRRLSNNTGGREDDKDDKKKDEEDNYLNDNAIDVEVEILRKMERTTVKVRNYPPVTEATQFPVTADIVSVDPRHVAGLSMLAPSIPLPFTPGHPRSHDLDFGTRTTVSYATFSSPLSSGITQEQHYIQKLIQRPNVTKLSAIPSFISASAPIALPIPPSKAETSPSLFNIQSQNSGISALISNGHFRNSGNTNARNIDNSLRQRHLPGKIQVQMQVHPREQEPLDDILGCTWDIVTNSCKDLFSLKLCSHCHDFGNIFLHNCKCLLKYITTFQA